MRPVASKTEILERLERASGKMQPLGVRRLSLFGSWARNAAHAASDIDLLVEFRPGEKNFVRYIQLAEFCEQLLGRPVDLVTTDSLSPHIGPKIRAEAVDVVCAA